MLPTSSRRRRVMTSRVIFRHDAPVPRARTSTDYWLSMIGAAAAGIIVLVQAIRSDDSGVILTCLILDALSVVIIVINWRRLRRRNRT